MFSLNCTDKLVRREEELDGVDLYVVFDGVSGPPGFGVTGGPSFCPPTGFSGCDGRGAAEAAAPGGRCLSLRCGGLRCLGGRCLGLGWLGLRETRGHETERVDARGPGSETVTISAIAVAQGQAPPQRTPAPRTGTHALRLWEQSCNPGRSRSW